MRYVVVVADLPFVLRNVECDPASCVCKVFKYSEPVLIKFNETFCIFCSARQRRPRRDRAARATKRLPMPLRAKRAACSNRINGGRSLLSPGPGQGLRTRANAKRRWKIVSFFEDQALRLYDLATDVYARRLRKSAVASTLTHESYRGITGVAAARPATRCTPSLPEVVRALSERASAQSLAACAGRASEKVTGASIGIACSGCIERARRLTNSTTIHVRLLGGLTCVTSIFCICICIPHALHTDSPDFQISNCNPA